MIDSYSSSQVDLTPLRFDDFDVMSRRNRSLVNYIWLCLELEEYNCTKCSSSDPNLAVLSATDDALIVRELEKLFSSLSKWEADSNVLLDISVYSPSDSEHWFKSLTFWPDTPPSETHGQHQGVERETRARVDDRRHIWNTAGQIRATTGSHGLILNQHASPIGKSLNLVFAHIMGCRPFKDEEQEKKWWRQLPLVPAVTSILLRQQTRRRWKPSALAEMFARLPRLQEIHYEPWREWIDDGKQKETDYCEYCHHLVYCHHLLEDKTNMYAAYYLLLHSLSSSQQLKKLTLFENFNEEYPPHFANLILGTRSNTFRTANPVVSQTIAQVSINLEYLAASYLVEAKDFFASYHPSWTWPALTSLSLTSQLLTPTESPLEIANLLQSAAAVAMHMPNLEVMEIWNGRRGLAGVFRYHWVKPSSNGAKSTVTITCRGTWKFDLNSSVRQAWGAVAFARCGGGFRLVKELVDRCDIRCHGDAIYHLKLSEGVIRSISLSQIRAEHKVDSVRIIR